jgi:outer membrane autotransporter protein
MADARHRIPVTSKTDAHAAAGSRLCTTGAKLVHKPFRAILLAALLLGLQDQQALAAGPSFQMDGASAGPATKTVRGGSGSSVDRRQSAEASRNRPGSKVPAKRPPQIEPALPDTIVHQGFEFDGRALTGGDLLTPAGVRGRLWDDRPSDAAPRRAYSAPPDAAFPGAGPQPFGFTGENVLRNSQVFNTWNYLAPRPIPATLNDEYGWARQRTDLSNVYNNDALREFGANWGNSAVGQSIALNLATPGGLNGWRGRGITVAVIDGGIDARFANPNNPAQGFAYVHPEFAGRLDLRSRRPFADGTFDTLIADDPSNSHGTHVAGTIAAGFDGVGMVGIAPGANILALKAVGVGAGDPVAAMNFAASQADVRIINGSYGPSARPGDTIWFTGSLDAEAIAVRNALAAGKLLVFANGNDFQRAPDQAVNPTGIPLYPYIHPANLGTRIYNDGGRNYDFSFTRMLPGMIIAVANLDHNLEIGASSNRCGVAASWCISAPGGGGSIDARGILSTVVQGAQNGIGPGNGYAYEAGTSMAAPHVAGVLAVLMEAYPGYTPRDYVRLIFGTAQDLGARGVDRIYGHGLIRLDRALAAGPVIANTPDVFVRAIPAGQPEFWAAPINTERELLVQGTRGAGDADDGDLIIAGVARFGGGVRISTGDLVVEGTLRAPTITVGADAALTGDGIVIGNVIVDGALNPGSGPGPLFIQGHVTMRPGGEFQVDVDGLSDFGGPGGHSQLIIYGSGNVFTAGGRFMASFRGQDEGADNTFVTRIGHRFKVISAEGGARVEGRFASLAAEVDDAGQNGLPANSRLALIYRPTSVTLAINPESFANLRSAGIWLNSRQSGVGLALDRMQDPVTGAITGRAADLFDAFEGLGPQEIAPALQQLSGSGHASVLRGAMTSGQQFSGVIGERMGTLMAGGPGASGPAPAMAFASGGGFALSAQDFMANYPPARAAPVINGATPQFTIWGKVFGQWSRLGGDGIAQGTRATGGGVTVGADMAVAPGLIAGAAAGYARNRTTGDGVAGDSTSYFSAIYSAYANRGFELDGMAGLVHSEFQTQRSIRFGAINADARSTAKGTGFIGSAEFGYRFSGQLGAPVSLKPFIGLSHNSLGRGAFAETGAGALGLAFPSQNFATTQARIGLAFGATLQGADGITYQPEASIAWARNLSDTTLSYRAMLIDQMMILPAVRTGRDAVQTNVRMTAVFNDRFRMFVGYAGEHRSNAATHRIEGGLRVSW